MGAAVVVVVKTNRVMMLLIIMPIIRLMLMPGGEFLVTGYGAPRVTAPNDVLFLRLDEHAQEVERFVIQGPEDERAMKTAVSSCGLLGTVGYAQRDGQWGITLLHRYSSRPRHRQLGACHAWRRAVATNPKYPDAHWGLGSPRRKVWAGTRAKGHQHNNHLREDGPRSYL